MAGDPGCDHRFQVAKHGWAEGPGWRSVFVVRRCATCGAERQREDSRTAWPPVETVTKEAHHAH